MPLMNLLNFVTYILVITAYHFTIWHLVNKKKNLIIYYYLKAISIFKGPKFNLLPLRSSSINSSNNILIFLFVTQPKEHHVHSKLIFKNFLCKKKILLHISGCIKKVSIQNLNKSHFGLNNSVQYIISPVFKIIFMTGISLAHMTISSTLFETIKHFQENYRIL